MSRVPLTDYTLARFIEKTLDEFDEMIKTRTQFLLTDGDKSWLENNKEDLSKIRAFIDVKLQGAYNVGVDRAEMEAAQDAAGASL